MSLLFAYGAGFLTLLNPCVLPVLPIVLASALQAQRHGPIALAAGLGTAFVVAGLLAVTLGQSVGLDQDVLTTVGASLMIGFGLVQLVPPLSARFATAAAGLAARSDAHLSAVDRSSLRGQFLGGLLLGAVWSPCIGPTLGGAISLAARGESLIWAAAVMTAFALGIATVMLSLAHGTRHLIGKRQGVFRRLSKSAKAITGVAFIGVGFLLLSGAHHLAEAWLVRVLPLWLQRLTVSL